MTTCCESTRKKAQAAADRGVWPYYTCPHCGAVYRGGKISAAGRIKVVRA